MTRRRSLVAAACLAASLAGCGSTAYTDVSYRRRAASEFQVGHLPEAEALCRQALRRNPSDPFALY